ncbi:MAG: histidinol-phosphate transaminase [Deltaproteobacteria bacterium]|nr:histidinol-phosphate transaminase [Deltaproteobacteria bacterium]MBI3391340.1 histidinol-phosphate transaminase [Deltaproteobacteria bacterium]
MRGDAQRFVRPGIRALHGYVPGEQPRDRRYVKLNTNENPYPPSPRVIEAVRAAVIDDLRLYPDPVATELRRKAGEVYGFAPEQIIAGNGSDDLLALIVRACASAGDRVVYPMPTYSLYDTLVAIQDAEAAHVPFPADFTLPVAALRQLDGRVTFVCNPNAPSGTVTPVAVIEELARALSGLLVVDEAYVDFADATALPLVQRCPNVVVLRTFSKSFSLAGMRIGLGFGSAAVIEELNKVKDSYNLSRLSLVAATAALEDLAWMQRNVTRIRTTRAALSERLRALGLQVLPSQANFILARRPGRNMGDIQRALKEQGVLVRYFDTPDLRDALRITVGTDEECEALLVALKPLLV